MATEVVMPQMGESIAEGTVTKWLKQPGDHVERDEPLFEISTDKVDAEIPSPAEGTLLEILVPEGETVEVKSIVAKIGEAGESANGGSAPAAEPEAPKAEAPKAEEPKAAAPASAASTPKAEASAPASSREDRIQKKSSPLVRKIAAEHGIDITDVDGTGVHGRVTKSDIEAHIENREKAPAASAAPAPAKAASAPAQGGFESPILPVGANDTVKPMSRMRQIIAERMVSSKRISPHVHTLYEVDMSQVDRLRKAHKESFAKAGGGAKLSYTVFVTKAVIDAIRQVPEINASISGTDVIYHGDINIGMAVSLDEGKGLIVPVIKNSQDLSMTGLAKSIADVAGRARTRKLLPDEVEGSTFTITNPGSYGGLVGMPVINQPNVAILGVGKIEKRVCVVDDMIAIRPKMFISLGYDHRLIDGALAEQFLSTVTKILENFDETAI